MFSICFLLNINDIYKGVIALIFMKQLRIIPVSGNEHFDIKKRKALLLKLKIVRGLQPAHPDYK